MRHRGFETGLVGSSPRVRGTRHQPRPWPVGCHGSSPRVRGTHRRRLPAHCAGRFIPACAGNTRNCAASCGRRSVHPRVCGEHHEHELFRCAGTGSSPRVRGTPLRRAHRGRHVRFIPACAGNTAGADASRNGMAVHPRVCGEHTAVLGRYIAKYGSSPRVRGTRTAKRPNSTGQRFIPACAGNTPAEQMRMLTYNGSSPRVRGTLKGAQIAAMPCRFIPACAGNTYSAPTCSGTTPVHPRVCGVSSDIRN